MADNNTVILRVQLDEAGTEKKLQEVTLAIEQTTKAQAALKAERKAGLVTDEQFAKQSVDLATRLKGQRAEYAANTKNLELYRTATGDLANTYKGTQAQLSLAQRQFQLLEGSQDNSSESAKELGKTIDGLRNTLKATDETQSLFVRNIGNYPKNGNESLEKLVQQLVSLQEEQKRYVMGSEQEVQVRQRIGFFQQAAAQAGAKEGKTYEETTDFVRQYGEAIRPATADLIALTEAQQQAAQSGEATGEAMAQIGFKIGQAEKSIKEATDALKEVPEVAAEGAKETKGLGAGLLEAAQSSDVLGGAVEVLSGAKEKYTTAVNLAKAATAAEVGVLGLLKLALLATGIGIFVVVLGSVVAFLTKTQAGTDFLSRKMAALGAVVRIISNLFVDLGGKIFAAAENPKQAFSDLVTFIETNLGNRLKAFGVLLDAIRNRDFTKLADGVVQLGTGITDATAKAKAFAQQVDAAATAGERLAQMERDLLRAQNDNIATNKTLLNEVERLKNVRDNEFNNIQVRKKANEDAYKVELQREKELTNIAQQQIDVLAKKLALEGGRGRNEELFADLQRARNELKDIQEDAAGKQNELITNRYQLEQEVLDKAIERRAQANALEVALLNRQLAQVQVNSDKELSLRQQLLNKGHEAEINVKNLTVKQKQAIDVKYETDSQKLLLDTAKARMLASYEAEAATIAAELTLVKVGTDQETALRREAIDAQLRKELAALDQRRDNAAQEALLRGNAAQALNDLNYGAALVKLDRFLGAQRNALDENFAAARISEKEYNDAVIISEQLAAGSRLQLAREFKQDTVQLEAQAAAAKIAGIKKVGDAERAEQAKRMAQAQSLAEGITSLFAETVSTTGATLEDFARKSLILLIDTIEKQVIASQIKIIAESLASADSIATFGISGLVKSAAIIGLVVAATETLKSKLQPTTSQFAGGTVLGGASHAHGGVQLYSRAGHHFGEAEKDEIILSKGVWQNPLLRPLASQLNVMGGGQPLVPNFPTPRMALGGVAQPLILEQLKGQVGQGIDYSQLGKVLADELRANPPRNVWSDFESASKRNAETKRLGNS